MAVIGSAYVVVRALTNKLEADINRAVNRAATGSHGSGESIGDNVSKGFSDEIDGRLESSIGSEFDQADRDSGGSGTSIGSHLAEAFQKRIKGKLDDPLATEIANAGRHASNVFSIDSDQSRSGAASATTFFDGFSNNLADKIPVLLNSQLSSARSESSRAGADSGDAFAASFAAARVHDLGSKIFEVDDASGAGSKIGNNLVSGFNASTGGKFTASLGEELDRSGASGKDAGTALGSNFIESFKNRIKGKLEASLLDEATSAGQNATSALTIDSDKTEDGKSAGTSFLAGFRDGLSTAIPDLLDAQFTSAPLNAERSGAESGDSFSRLFASRVSQLGQEISFDTSSALTSGDSLGNNLSSGFDRSFRGKLDTSVTAELDLAAQHGDQTGTRLGSSLLASFQRRVKGKLEDSLSVDTPQAETDQSDSGTASGVSFFTAFQRSLTGKVPDFIRTQFSSGQGDARQAGADSGDAFGTSFTSRVPNLGQKIFGTGDASDSGALIGHDLVTSFGSSIDGKFEAPIIHELEQVSTGRDSGSTLGSSLVKGFQSRITGQLENSLVTEAEQASVHASSALILPSDQAKSGSASGTSFFNGFTQSLSGKLPNFMNRQLGSIADDADKAGSSSGDAFNDSFSSHVLDLSKAVSFDTSIASSSGDSIGSDLAAGFERHVDGKLQADINQELDHISQSGSDTGTTLGDRLVGSFQKRIKGRLDALLASKSTVGSGSDASEDFIDGFSKNFSTRIPDLLRGQLALSSADAGEAGKDAGDAFNSGISSRVLSLSQKISFDKNIASNTGKSVGDSVSSGFSSSIDGKFQDDIHRQFVNADTDAGESGAVMGSALVSSFKGRISGKLEDSLVSEAKQASAHASSVFQIDSNQSATGGTSGTSFLDAFTRSLSDKIPDFVRHEFTPIIRDASQAGSSSGDAFNGSFGSHVVDLSKAITFDTSIASDSGDAVGTDLSSGFDRSVSGKLQSSIDQELDLSTKAADSSGASLGSRLLASFRRQIKGKLEDSITVGTPEVVQGDRSDDGAASAGSFFDAFQQTLSNKIPDFIRTQFTSTSSDAERSGDASGSAFSASFISRIPNIGEKIFTVGNASDSGATIGDDFTVGFSDSIDGKLEASVDREFEQTSTSGKTRGSALGLSLVEAFQNRVKGKLENSLTAEARQASTRASNALQIDPDQSNSGENSGTSFLDAFTRSLSGKIPDFVRHEFVPLAGDASHAGSASGDAFSNSFGSHTLDLNKAITFNAGTASESGNTIGIGLTSGFDRSIDGNLQSSIDQELDRASKDGDRTGASLGSRFIAAFRKQVTGKIEDALTVNAPEVVTQPQDDQSSTGLDSSTSFFDAFKRQLSGKIPDFIRTQFSSATDDSARAGGTSGAAFSASFVSRIPDIGEKIFGVDNASESGATIGDDFVTGFSESTRGKFGILVDRELGTADASGKDHGSTLGSNLVTAFQSRIKNKLEDSLVAEAEQASVHASSVLHVDSDQSSSGGTAGTSFLDAFTRRLSGKIPDFVNHEFAPIVSDAQRAGSDSGDAFNGSFGSHVLDLNKSITFNTSIASGSGSTIGTDLASGFDQSIDGKLQSSVDQELDHVGQDGSDSGALLGAGFTVGFQRRIKNRLTAFLTAENVGGGGSDAGSSFANGFTKNLSTKIPDLLHTQFAGISADAGQAGQDSGEAFNARFAPQIPTLEPNIAPQRGTASSAGQSIGDNIAAGFKSKIEGQLESVIGAELDKSVVHAAASGDASGNAYQSSYSRRLATLPRAIETALQPATRSAENIGSSSGDSFREGFSERIGRMTKDDVDQELEGIFAASGFNIGRDFGIQIRAGIDDGIGDGGGVGGGGGGGGGPFGGIERAAGDSGDRSGRNFARNFGRGFASVGDGLFRIIARIAVLGTVISVALGGISALVSGLFALGAAAGAAASALVVLPSLLGALGQGVIAAVIAFGGIGTAVKAATQAQTQGATESKRAAEQQVLAARSVRDARENLADTYENTAQRMVDAEDAVTEASKRLKDAQDEERDAQNDIGQARLDAAERLQQLGFSVRQASIDEREASKNLADAQRSFAEALLQPLPDTPDLTEQERLQITLRRRAEAQDSLEEAQLTFERTTDKASDLRREQEEQSKKGVEGSDEVVQAKQREADAVERVQEAEERLGDARADIAKTEQANARAIRDARERLNDSIKDQKQAQDSVTASTTRLNQAMSRLSPEAQHFVGFIVRLRPEIDKLRAAAGKELFPKLEIAISSLVRNFFPALRRELQDTGSAVGDAAISIADGINEVTRSGDFKTISDTNERSIRRIGAASGSLTVAFGNILAAASPLIDRFTRFIKAQAELFAQWTDAKQKSGALTDGFNRAGDVAAQLGRIIGNLAKGFFILGRIAAPAGQSLLDSFEGATKTFTKIGDSRAKVAQLQQVFANIADNVRAISRLALTLGGVLFRLGGNKGITSISKGLEKLALKLEPLLNTMIERFGPALTQLITTVSEIFAEMSKSGGLEVALGIFQEFANVFLAIVKTDVGKQLLVTLAAFKALRAVSKFSGITGLVETMGKSKILKGFAAGLRADSAELKGFSGLAQRAGGRLRTFFFGAGEAAEGAGTKVGLMSKIFGKGGIVAAAFSKVVRGLGLAFRFMLGPVGLIIAGIALLVGGVILLYKKNKAFRDFVDNVLMPALRRLGDFVKNVLGAAFGAIATFLTGTVIPAFRVFANFIENNVFPIFKAIGGFIADHVIPVFSALFGSFHSGEGVISKFSGALQKVGDFLNDFVLVPWIAFVTFMIQHVFPIFGDIIKLIARLVNVGFKLWIGEIKLIIKVFAVLIETIKKIIGWFIAFGKKAFEIAASVVGFFTDVVDFFNKLPGVLANAGKKLFSWIGDKAKAAGKAAINFATGFITFYRRLPARLATAGKKLFSWIGDKLDKIWKAFKNFNQKIIDIFAKLPGKLFNEAKNAFNFLVEQNDKIKKKISEFIDDIVGFFKDLPGKVADAAKDAFGFLVAQNDKIKKKIGDFIESLVDIVKDLPVKLANAGKKVWDWVADKFGDMRKALGDRITNFLADMGELPTRLANKAKDIWSWVTQKFGDMRAALGEKILGFIEAISGLKDRLANKAGDIWSWITSKFGDMRTALGDRITNFVDAIRGLPARLANAGAGLFDFIKNGFIGAINWVIKKWNALDFKIGGQKVFGQTLPSVTISTPDIPLIKTAASGGTFDATEGGQLVLLAEGGRDERVTPLDSQGLSAGDKAVLAAIKELARNSGKVYAPNIIVHGQETPRKTAQEILLEQRRAVLASNLIWNS